MADMSAMPLVTVALPDCAGGKGEAASLESTAQLRLGDEVCSVSEGGIPQSLIQQAAVAGLKSDWPLTALGTPHTALYGGGDRMRF
jgi:hypothetical protein